MDSLLPAELWTQIFHLACTDTGFTGCSISKTCRYFYEVSKPVKLRSLAIQGVASARCFLEMIEVMPPNRRAVQNLYLSLYDPTLGGEEMYDDESAVFRQECDTLIALYNPDLDPREPSQRPTKEEISLYPEEQRMHLVIRILSAVATSVQFLYLSFGNVEKSILLPPISFPSLCELVLYGDYDQIHADLKRLVPIPSLRRLTLSNIYGHELSATPVLAPNLTHLRLNHRSTDSSRFLPTLKEHLQQPATTTPRDTRDSPPPMPFPKSLERFIICSVSTPQFMCGNAWRYVLQAQRALDQFVKADSRVISCKDLKPKSLFSHIESLQEWLARTEGQLACWDEAKSLSGKV